MNIQRRIVATHDNRPPYTMAELHAVNPEYKRTLFKFSFKVPVLLPAGVRLWSRKRRIRWQRHRVRRVAGFYKKIIAGELNRQLLHMAGLKMGFLPRRADYIVPILFKRHAAD